MNMHTESQQLLKELLTNKTLFRSIKRDRATFQQRLEEHFPLLYELLSTVYSQHDDLQGHIVKLVETLALAYQQRPGRLKEKDLQRMHSPDWHQQEQMVGMACYVDLLAGDLKGLQSKIPYLSDLGISYLHLMPLYACPDNDSDGGYAVSDYRQVKPSLGDMNDLRELGEKLDKAGISLVLDFVFNHTSDEHAWAKAARAGEVEFENYYFLFSDRNTVDAYEATLREIFPQQRRGNFTYLEDVGKWVWTTFNSFQWDLNYSNPAVFCAIAGEMLFLANAGADVLRLDALAFIWKDIGTSCENRPNAHKLIQAFHCCLQIAAPAVVFKSEAIVHPDDVVQYISPKECQLSYNPLLMALIWNSLATRKTRLLTQSMSHRFAIHPDCTWVNYARCHDDIGWTFSDGDAAVLGIDGYNHRLFLNRYYTGQFEGSFATGLGFQLNPENGDCRVCGSLASLAGLEQALHDGNEQLIEMAVRRVLLIHSILMSIGGIPLLYAGDELGLLNDYSFQSDPDKQHDSRWVNRPRVTNEAVALAMQKGTVPHRINAGLRKMIELRKSDALFGAAKTSIEDSGNPHLFCYRRSLPGGRELLVVCNFSDHTQTCDPESLFQRQLPPSVSDLWSGRRITLGVRSPLEVAPFQFLWLCNDS